MKHWTKALFFCLIAGISSRILAQNIEVDDTYTAQQLVQYVLIDSPCANVTNFSVSGDTFSAGQQSYGYFTNTSPLFPFTDGIVLSTARAVRSEGPNDNLVDEGSGAWLGDQDLEDALIGFIPNIHTLNATVLEFDFTPLTSQISFDYIFASEEYSGTAPCRYSDGFAFLLKPAGTDLPYQNLAVLPNSNTPVLVTTVHPQIGSSCPAINEEYFGSFNDPSYPVNFNGQTVVLTAKATVIPGTTYHIKLVIADDENIRYDSAIFLAGGSFKVGTDIGPDRLIATDNPVCFGETYTLDATEPGSNTYQWFKNNDPIPGATNPTYDVTDAGVYSVEVNLGGAGCIATGQAVIEYVPLPVLNDPTTLVQCDDDNDGIAVFDLTKADGIVTMGEMSLLPVTYFPTLADAQNQTNGIANPATHQATDGSTVIARVESAYGCVNFSTVILSISNNAIAPQNPIETCDDDGVQDGITGFVLSTQVTPQILAGLPAGLSVSYFESTQSAMLGVAPLPDNFTNMVPMLQTIYARIVNGADCYGIIPVTLVVHAFDPSFSNETVYLCNGNPQTIGVSNTFSSYLWSSGQTSPMISVATAGTYSVTVSDANGCTATKNFNVIDSGIATITNIAIHDFAGDGNSVRIEVSGSGLYEYSLDGAIWQDSNVFNGIAPGEYQVFVRDKNGCGTTHPMTFYVLDYPRFFTPNGDGYNDLWTIKNLETRQGARISIFDRYGKLLKYQDAETLGWNGRYNGVDLPSADYWFTLEFPDGRIVKGHFSLKR